MFSITVCVMLCTSTRCIELACSIGKPLGVRNKRMTGSTYKHLNNSYGYFPFSIETAYIATFLNKHTSIQTVKQHTHM